MAGPLSTGQHSKAILTIKFTEVGVVISMGVTSVFSPGPFSVSARYAFAIVSVLADIP